MKTMKIEKQLLFDDKISGVDHLQITQGLTYEKESDGSIRASGPLFIRGEITTQHGEQPFQEVLDMDVLAPAYKLSGEDFSLSIKNFYGDIDDEGINLIIEMNICGLKEDGSDVVIPEESEPQPIAQMIPSMVEHEEKFVEEPVEDNNHSVEEFEDLFEEGDTTYTSYRMVVARADDSYTSIANRYDVEEEALRNVNRGKDVIAKSLIVLPF